jgi:hypothetical protein
MKRIISIVAALASTAAFGQATMTTNSAAMTSSMGIGGGAASSEVRSSGNATATGGDPTAAVILNMAPAATQPVANAQQGSGGETTTNVNSKVKSVGTPGSMSLGISFSQYNCANSAGGGVGFMGGVIQIGGGMESDPCNARANASAFYQIAQTLATSNPTLSAQLYHAAILLIGNSTKSTKEALSVAGVADWTEVPAGQPVTPVPAPVGNTKYPSVATAAIAAAPIINRVTPPLDPVVETSIAVGSEAESIPVSAQTVIATAMDMTDDGTIIKVAPKKQAKKYVAKSYPPMLSAEVLK